jgi:hypothetical protein
MLLLTPLAVKDLLQGRELAKAVLGATGNYAVISLGLTGAVSLCEDGMLNVDDDDVELACKRMSVRIHPDKIGRGDEELGKQAFERLQLARSKMGKNGQSAGNESDEDC